ncbi:16S rRNA (guanine(527)-N(7))-methyltransferase RsmG [Microbulbifer thermotolerans]|uniref:Ribosomal RNA small subunit methyltransferase G n=1 Tax=Microbulbifer thermotolerans TaxID=252514 RepID=A0A143HR42_MICTH|nr:16S rRNA (guanine(527)-N(7))-methyltransferase RsmG [Microbulbifer thermotolerans]AMX03937.1 16S rRNA methyltransferase G [Microbulbifer thermotolerans]MCX2778535.1 16S rRNA (guanine(527)-N(7))-methyltransferase RsmG [Microbulbifer thermotolerans]MCX2782910.1 16S rRNA (guanine(527)-N(7))-methyltransferase RsmG [Microbulbifer thermotolerans]MCX2794019.1 16S rRNA (guanine(527)-N(7))-methyltransferase RsmG [Microbulbifer thermotolerans]MCX2801723.1 16S rRNA (guanine(527)-N(7))-methyltransferas
MEAFRPRLVEAASQLSVELSAVQQDQLLQYLALFARWNAAYNLSAIRDPQQMLERHIIDSLSVVDLCGEGPLIDVGSGGGLPGIPLAIAHPERPVTLLDSNGKKTRFLFQVACALPLPNVQVVNKRVEAFAPEEKFAAVVSRAFASIADMVLVSEHLLSSEGRFYAMKGKLPEDELSGLPKGIKVEQVRPLSVPGCDADRHLIVLRREATRGNPA